MSGIILTVTIKVKILNTQKKSFKMIQSLTGKVAIITSAAKGIGKATEIESYGVKAAYATADVPLKSKLKQQLHP